MTQKILSLALLTIALVFTVVIWFVDLRRVPVKKRLPYTSRYAKRRKNMLAGLLYGSDILYQTNTSEDPCGKIIEIKYNSLFQSVGIPINEAANIRE